MRKASRLLLHTRLVTASLLLGTGAGLAAQDHESHVNMAMDVAAPGAITRTVKWSDTVAWPAGKVPAAGEDVIIARGTEVLLDVSPPELRSLTVQGKLTFVDERDLSLTTEWIYLPGGQLEIGTEADPFEHQATITLTDKVPGEDVNTMGDRGIMMLRGSLIVHGATTHTWSKLSQTAEKGATSIEVLDASGWSAGD